MPENAPSICIRCDYDLSGDPARCPECGLERDRDVRAVEVKRAGVIAGWGRTIRRFALWSAVVAVLYGCGVWLLSWDGVMVGVVTAGVLGLAITGSLGVGWIATLFARPTLRTLLMHAWVRALPYAHAPWLVAPIMAGVALLTRGIEVWFGAGETLMIVMVIGLVSWLLGCCVSAVIAGTTFVAGRDELRVHAGGLSGLLVLAQIGVSLGAMLLGFMAGAFSVDTAMSVFPDPDAVW